MERVRLNACVLKPMGSNDVHALVARYPTLPHAREHALVSVVHLGKAHACDFEFTKEEQQPERLITVGEAVRIQTNLLKFGVVLVEVVPVW